MSDWPAEFDSLPVDVEDRERGKTGEPDKSKPTGAGFHAQLHNHVNEAVMAIEQTLGIKPQGGDADVATRLDTIDAALAGGDSELTNAVAALTSAINAKQDASSAATDAELTSAVATLNAAIAAKQDASTAATDADLEAAVDSLTMALGKKQDASSAATDAELASAVSTINATIGSEKTAREAGDAAANAAASAAQSTADAALPKAGGPMTGPLTLAADATTNLGAVTKQQLTAAITALVNGAPEALDTLKEISDRLGLDESAEATLIATVATKSAKSANLSDLADAVAARSNLGLGTAAVKASADFDTAGAAAAEEGRAKAAEAAVKGEVKNEKERAEAAEAAKLAKTDSGSPGQVGKVLDAASVMYLWPTDSRLVNPIDLTEASFSDKGLNELIALAAAGPYTIALPAGAKIKCEKSFYVPGGVQFITVGSGKAAQIKFPVDQGQPTYALLNAALTKGATKIPLIYVTGKGFAAATPEAPKEAFVAQLGMVTYTGIEGEGETITLTGVTGVTKALSSSKYSVIQGIAVYADTGSEITRSTVFERGIRILGPTTGTQESWSTEAQPTNSMDGVWVGSNIRVNCQVSGFRHSVAFTADHAVIGQDYRPSNCYSSVAWMGPRMTAGDHMIEDGTLLTGAWWCSVFVADGNYLNNVRFGKTHLGGGAHWGIWKEATRGLSNSEQSSGFISTSSVLMHDPSFEACRMGGIGCPDGKAVLQGWIPQTPSFAWGNAPLNGLERKAPIACKVQKLNIIGASSFFTPFIATQQAVAISDEFVESSIDGFKAAIEMAAEKGIPLVKGKIGENPSIDITFKEGRVVGESPVDAEIKLGHVCSYRKPGAGSRGPRSNVARYSAPIGIAGVAARDAVNHVVELKTNSQFQTTVRVKEQSNPPTGVAAAANATAGTLEARQYFYKVVAVLSGGGLMAASAEVSATAEANKSIKVTWVAPAEIPHGQTITNYRVYRGTAAGAEAGYKQVGNVLEYLDSGAALTGATSPPTKNTGCEIYGIGLVRPYGAGAPGCACIASGPADNTAPVFAQTYEEPDNGETATVIITPALL